VLDLVLSALVPAGVADFGAQSADLVHHARATAHPRRCRPTDFRAIPVESDAFRHRGDIRFFETGTGAMLTFLGTADARFKARSVLFMGHDNPFPNSESIDTYTFTFEMSNSRAGYWGCVASANAGCVANAGYVKSPFP
jgi:hypothetical protein